MVTPSLAYWFGAHGYGEYNVWVRSDLESFSLDSDIALSWQGQYVGTDVRRGLSLVIRNGPGSTPPVLNITRAYISEGALNVEGSVTDDDQDLISVYAALNRNYGSLGPIVVGAHSGESFRQALSLGLWYLPYGDHVVEIFAVDHSGSVSEPHTVTLSSAYDYKTADLGDCYEYSPPSNYDPSTYRPTPDTPTRDSGGSKYVPTPCSDCGTSPQAAADALREQSINLIIVGSVTAACGITAALVWGYCCCLRPKLAGGGGGETNPPADTGAAPAPQEGGTEGGDAPYEGPGGGLL
jgi:hypothetical protein